MAETELQWRAPEFEERPKGVSWYWASICASVIILGFAVWNGNFLFGFFIVVAELLLLVWGNRTPEMMDFSLTAKSLRAGPRAVYQVADIENFSVAEIVDSEWETLVLNFKRGLRLPAAVPVPKDRLEEIKKIIGQTVPRVEHEQSLLDTLEKFLGF